MASRRGSALTLAIAVALAGCSGSSNTGDTVGTSPPPPATDADSGCTGSCVNAESFLSVADVETVIAQAVAAVLSQKGTGE